MRFLVYGLANEWGGVESIVMAMVETLSVRNNSFDIILSEKPASYEKVYQSHNVHFVHMPSWGSSKKKFAHGLQTLFQSNRYDYVWINGCLMANRTIISITKQYSLAKIITHSHGSSFEENNIIKRVILLSMHKWNRAYYGANVDFPCMCSRKSGLWFYGEDYIQTHHVHYVKNGVDICKYRFDKNIRDRYRFDLGLTNEFAVFHAGRLTEVKNQKRILSVFADLLRIGINAMLFIAGDGELRADLEKQSKKLKIDNKVRFLGNRSDVNCLYQAMDVMLLPSFHEGFPVTLTEAQASGLYCLVSDRVSTETNIIGTVQYLSIDKEDNIEWVNALRTISHINPIDRINSEVLFCQKGYDIESVCKDFLSFINASTV